MDTIWYKVIYMPSNEQKLIAVAMPIIGIFILVIAPLIIYLMYKQDRCLYLHINARNTLNWQIQMLLLVVLGYALTFVLVGVVLLFLLPIINIVFSIIAAIKMGGGETFEYPFCIRFIR